MVITNFEKTRKRYAILRKTEIEWDMLTMPDDTFIVTFWVKWNTWNKWTIKETKVDGKKTIRVQSKHYNETFHTYKAVNDFIKDKIKL